MLEELQLRNLSETTIHTYWRLVERCAKHFGASPAKLGPDHVRRYLLHLLKDKKDSLGYRSGEPRRTQVPLPQSSQTSLG